VLVRSLIAHVSTDLLKMSLNPNQDGQLVALTIETDQKSYSAYSVRSFATVKFTK
jgi:hypothetical protein